MTSYLLSLGFYMLAFQVSESVALALIVQLAAIVMFLLKDRADRRQRKEERDERILLAKLTHDNLEAVKIEGGKREERIVKEVKQVKQVAIAGVKSAKVAYKEANGVNAKIESLGKQLVDEKQTPQQVEIMNTTDHPVPTEITNQDHE